MPLLTPEELERAATDPAYATRLVHHLIATGRITPTCDEQPCLTPEQEDAARVAVGGGPEDKDDKDDKGDEEGKGGEEYVGASRCVLWPRHSRWHYAVVRHLGPDTLWVKWNGPFSELLALPDCDAINAVGECCNHFRLHPGPHNFPSAMA
ncbi:hypothetical protein [Streptomyces sp. NPDC048644]|uniref:hypothetical protein n=1 Tax=Streptomyces sp. NPDC048644 TaxID=3365582 RepID=UPI003721D161